ncbi:MAG: arginine--tRNA ligase [Defluviitaleaceae bacterium]|nr:arginine--tRNA ligase [Defluviitaleaceae bacterium]
MYYEQALAGKLADYTGLPFDEIYQAIETPQDPKLGDLAFPCFRLAKAMKKAPPVIAQEIAASLGGDTLPWISEARATGPYVNIFLNRRVFAGKLLSAVLKDGVNYGAGGVGEGQKVLVEYSSPNIAKHFHVGHLGSTMIGKALDKIYRFLGYDVTSINYLGDWGTQFGKLITAYLKWGSKEEIEKTEIDGLVKLYVKFHEEADKDPSLNDEARAWVVRMQDGNEEGFALWRWFIDLSLREYNRLYDRLNIAFDEISSESRYSGKMDAVVSALSEKGLLQESEGAQIVDLEAHGMPPCLILRSDGGTLYPTRDIAAAYDRYETYKFTKSLYVTGNEQSLNFAQWIKVVELMGNEWAKGIVHVPYGMLLFEEGKLSTRRGQVIKVDDLLNEAVSKALAIIEEKNPGLENKEAVAEMVGIGALVFGKLYTSRMKDTMFSWDRMLSFDGETGPYVQYAHARCCSVLAKAGLTPGTDLAQGLDTAHLADNEAFTVMRLLYDYPARIKEAAEKYESFLVARHMVALAQAYNAFYHQHIILVEDAPGVRQARLALTAAVRDVLKSGLELLNIAAPESM